MASLPSRSRIVSSGRGAPDPARPRSRRGRDAAGAAVRLAGPPPATRPDPLRGLVVPAPRARLLHGGPQGPSLGAEPSADALGEPPADDDLSSVVDRDQLERGFRRLSTRSPHGGGPVPLPRPAARRIAEISDPDRDGPLSTSSRDARAAVGTRCRPAADVAGGEPMIPNGRLAHRPVVASGGRARVRGPGPRHRAGLARRDPTAPALVAGAEVPPT